MLIYQYSALEKVLIGWQIMRIIFIPLRMATDIIIIFSKGAGTQALYPHIQDRITVVDLVCVGRHISTYISCNQHGNGLSAP